MSSFVIGRVGMCREEWEGEKDEWSGREEEAMVMRIMVAVVGEGIFEIGGGGVERGTKL